MKDAGASAQPVLDICAILRGYWSFGSIHLDAVATMMFLDTRPRCRAGNHVDAVFNPVEQPRCGIVTMVVMHGMQAGGTPM
jgi:hypothetical protein